MRAFGKRQAKNPDQALLGINKYSRLGIVLAWIGTSNNRFKFTPESDLTGPLRQVAFNRDHASTKYFVGLIQVKKENRDHKESNQLQITSLEVRLQQLEGDYNAIQTQIAVEQAHRKAVSKFCRDKLESCEEVCSLYKRTALPDLLPLD